MLRAPAESVTGILELAPTANLEQVRQCIEAHGGKVRAALAESNSMTFEIDAQHLAELAEMNGVLFVSTQEKYQA